MGDEAQVAALQAGAGSGSAEGGRGAGAGEGGRGGGGGGSGGGGGGGGVNPQHMMGGRAPAGMLGGGGGGGAAGGGSYMAAGPATAPAMGGSMMPYGGGGGGMMPPGGGGGMPPAGPPPGRGPRSGPPAAGLMGGPMGGPDGGGGRGGGYDAGGPAAAAAAGSNIVNNVLKLRGLPFSASAAEVAAWFAAGGLPIAQLSADKCACPTPWLLEGRLLQHLKQACGLCQALSYACTSPLHRRVIGLQSPDCRARSVRLITNREGRATGQAFVEFPTQAEAEAGLAMDRQMMGNRYVEARPCVLKGLAQLPALAPKRQPSNLGTRHIRSLCLQQHVSRGVASVSSLMLRLSQACCLQRWGSLAVASMS